MNGQHVEKSYNIKLPVDTVDWLLASPERIGGCIMFIMNKGTGSR